MSEVGKYEVPPDLRRVLAEELEKIFATVATPPAQLPSPTQATAEESLPEAERQHQEKVAQLRARLAQMRAARAAQSKPTPAIPQPTPAQTNSQPTQPGPTAPQQPPKVQGAQPGAATLPPLPPASSTAQPPTALPVQVTPPSPPQSAVSQSILPKPTSPEPSQSQQPPAKQPDTQYTQPTLSSPVSPQPSQPLVQPPPPIPPQKEAKHTKGKRPSNRRSTVQQDLPPNQSRQSTESLPAQPVPQQSSPAPAQSKHRTTRHRVRARLGGQGAPAARHPSPVSQGQPGQPQQLQSPQQPAPPNARQGTQSPTPSPNQSQPQPPQSNQTLVGRSKEVNQIRDLVRKKRHPLVVGPVGIGKTHLLHWLAGSLPKAICIGCLTPLKPALLAGLKQLKDQKALRVAGIDAEYLDWQEVAKKLSRLTISDLAGVLVDNLRDKGYVLLLDELDRLTPTSIPIVERLLEVGTVVGATSALTQGQEQLWWQFQTIELPPFSRDEARTLLWRLVDGSRVRDRALFETKILAQANGNPLAIRQMAESVANEDEVDEQVIRRLSHPAGAKYVDLSLGLLGIGVAVVATRFIALGLNDTDLYILAGIGSAAFIALRLAIGYAMRKAKRGA